MQMNFHFRATKRDQDAQWFRDVAHAGIREAVAHAYAIMAGAGFDTIEVFYVNTYSGHFGREPTARVSR